MPRGTTLSTIRVMLKAEIGDYSGTNADRDAELNQLLINKQQQLVLEKQWPFMTRRWDSAVAAGTRFVTFPTVDVDFAQTALINFDEIEKVEVHWNNQWYPVQYGIGGEEYNQLDPTLGQSADPIRRWREVTNVGELTNANKYEVWPLPVGASTIRFTGERQLQAFAVDADKADLDDILLVLGVATDVLTRTKQPDAQIKGQLFARRLHQLGSRNPTRDVRRFMGGGSSDDKRRDIKLVAIH